MDAKLKEMTTDEEGNLRLVFEDQKDGSFSMGGTYTPYRYSFIVERSNFRKLRDLITKRKKRV